MPDMTDAEMAFFASGEVTDELLAANAAPEPAAAAPEPAPAAAEPAAAAPAPDNSALERLLTEERAARATLEQQFKDMQAQLEAKLNPPPPVPDEETDPLGAMMHKLNTVNKQMADMQTKMQQDQQQVLMKTQYDQFANSVTQLREAFVKVTPDFADAYAHIRGMRTTDLKMMGVPDADVGKVLLQDEITLAQNALANGKNPAEEMYNMAKRYGYTVKGAAELASSAAGASKIAALKQGMEAAKQPAKAAPDSDLTTEGLKDASNSDLNKLVQDEKAWARLVGGGSNDIFN